jgi:hypothetical protein
VKEAMNALLAARELNFLRVGARSLVQITPPKEAAAANSRRPQAVKR